MPPLLVAILLFQCCELCVAIKVPIVWSDSGKSEVKNEKLVDEFSVESFKPEDLLRDATTTGAPVPIPVEYFEYTAKKPDFAVEVAAFHGVKSPEKHYHAYPIEPDTGLQKPVLGQHRMLQKDKKIFKPFQKFVENHEGLQSHVKPASTDYEVFHPYKAEEPALEEIYKDPVLDKIRNDLMKQKDRLQKYEKEAGEPNITKDEYLESPEDTDRKTFPHKNIPAQYEVHRPLRRPVYYRRPPKFMQRERYLNKKFRHPLHQDYVKIKPIHYQPLKHDLYKFRQNQALKYDDEKNEYPQLPPPQHFAEPPDEGYDIYEKGKSRYVDLRNSIDGAINHAVLHNRPTTYQKLEEFDDGKYNKAENYYNPVPYDENYEEDEVTTEFVPIKSYAQVRKTETTKHLPKSAALEEASNYEELKNAPRLREAVKSTKAQTVYSEEGYEDTAYDHAGEQKHASDNEGHGGYLKEHEISGGKYRIPSVSAAYSDGGGSVYKDKTLHGDKWKNDDKDSQEEKEDEDYSDDDHEKLLEGDSFDDATDAKEQEEEHEQESRNKREESKEVQDDETQSAEESEEDDNIEPSETVQHGVIKREVDFKVPELDFNNTFFTEKDYANLKKQSLLLKTDEIKEKYPYYFKNLNEVHKNSPLRYAEDFKLIPKKSKGGTEFYDSRSEFVCPEVDDEVDPIPDKIKNNGTDSESSEETDKDSGDTKRKRRQANPDETKKAQRLKGLGDKIDCFKAKYFGANPLDSPFFKEDLIANPDPIPLPNIASFKIKRKEDLILPSTDILNITSKVKEDTENDFLKLLDSLRFGQSKLQESLKDSQSKFLASRIFPQNKTESLQQASIYTDVFDNIRKKLQKPIFSQTVGKNLLDKNVNSTGNEGNVTYDSFLNKELVTKAPVNVRKKRAAHFVYEPYKIIRDGQVQDSKKTTTTGNISPLIRQLQSSKVVDKVSLFDKDQPVKRNVATQSYKDIGRNERHKPNEDPDDSSDDSQFVNVNVDLRRGEPRYELKPPNHKPQYTPVDNKKAVSVEEYASITNKSDTKLDSVPTQRTRYQSRHETKVLSTTARPSFDVNKFLPKQGESQQLAASRTVHRVIRTTTPAVKKAVKQEELKQDTSNSSEADDEEYEEYEDSEEEEEQPQTTTTTTTVKPAFRRRLRVTSTTTTTTTTSTTTTPAPRTKKPRINIDNDQPTKLRLITRFNKPHASEKEEILEEKVKESPATKETKTEAPKYREKTKKSSKSTIVTDTKSYGEDNDEQMQKDEVDAMIRVKQDMDDYVPHYEKQIEKKSKEEEKPLTKDTNEEEDGDDEYEDDDEDENDDEEDSDEEYEDDDESEESQSDEKVSPTTPEPTKRTLPRTTEAPVSTTEARSSKLQVKPVVVKKKIEIHKELPVNRTSPHVTQFKQDIKEVEIIKELPRKRPNKNIEALELYKDDELAKKVNKLDDVEVFKQNLDLRQSPRHGGNYRSEKILELKEDKKPVQQHGSNLKARKKDPKPDDAQSEDTKVVPFEEDDIQVKKSNPRTNSRRTPQRSRSSNKNAELVELSDKITKPRLHGGNLKYKNPADEPKSEKLIELDEEEDEDDNNDSSSGGDYKSSSGSGSKGFGRPLHGGNYRSGKLIQAKTTTEAPKRTRERKVNLRAKSASNGHADPAKLLSSFAQAVPILTTTPAYILDPSKRMYYYVDA